MAKQYLDTYVGVKDGTKAPPDRLDGRKVGAKRSSIWGAKPAGVAWGIGDTILIADLAPGESVREINVAATASLGAATLAVGPLADPTKYVSPSTMTVANVPTTIGPKVGAAMAAPLDKSEDLYVTLGGAGIGAGVDVVFETVITSIK